jgi:flagellum-specific ATP synthase
MTTPSQPKPAKRPPNKLQQLSASLGSGIRVLPGMRVGGVVSEVTPAYCRVTGLSQFLKLGETVVLGEGKHQQVGEVVRIDEQGATIKPFEFSINAGLGTAAWRQGAVTISPHPSWKGRILNARGDPIDGAGR